MVSTRSHEHAKSTGGELRSTITANHPPSTTKKRKAPRDTDTNKKLSGGKRQHIDSGSSTLENPIPLTRDERLIVVTQSPSEKNAADSSFQRFSHVAVEKQDSSGTSQLTEIQKEQANGSENKRKSSSGAVSNRSSRRDTVEGVGKESASSNGRRAIHKRFGSEDIGPSLAPPEVNDTPDIQGGNLMIEDPAENNGYESEDEAPETVSVAAGILQSRRAAAEVAKAEETQKASTKLRRKERDARLKLQAKPAKKERAVGDQAPIINTEAAESAPQTAAAETREAPKVAKWSIGDPLPELLPEEILAAVPEMPSIPVLSSSQGLKAPVKTKLKIYHTISKPPKDIKRGSAVIRVLETDGGVLPPKVSKTSMSLRESWLTGRSGSQGKGFVPRRKIGGGFVRKQ